MALISPLTLVDTEPHPHRPAPEGDGDFRFNLLLRMDIAGFLAKTFGNLPPHVHFGIPPTNEKHPFNAGCQNHVSG